MIRKSIILLILLESLSVAEVASTSSWLLLGDFNRGWNLQWKERVLAKNANRYQLVNEGGKRALNIISDNSASGFWREWKVAPVQSGKIAWSWKVETSLAQNSKEREKKGDDYAARVFVVFEPHFFDWKTKSICYVWAAQEPEGSVFANPFSDSVGQIVLQSGNKEAGNWVQEERDFVADYKSYFKKAPSRVSAFAVMVDTDNTKARTKAWFRDLKIQVNR
jgi:Protein of unknown function (DUF3047)